MKPFAIDTTNGICAALFIAFGAFFALQSLGLEIGSAFRMGPGYFPLALAIVLLLLGVIILVQAVRFESEAIGHIAWRGMLLILPAPIFFGLTVRGLGFIPSIFLTALIASFASARMKPLTALVLSAGLTRRWSPCPTRAPARP
ncbi:tripartite tricarboxylate transporter TctB family protein [Mesorhizobium sp.]|uniref:tripartite tricarboxylate transporter TctB family protein n=1 Tax=Mesorhizobium sp. TaxID=1871066 RepID=UPI000FE64DA8|nr:tripartite tricarboxylate transporter TctB family protein [Mesorhizobium sp.]RWG05356.1 MAG: tripartite tricarboxylate transporter TctB family protein [Mesorhizobium sp.]RWH01018.1 MAG: tripartite tricarboxylate transporter TctB family protein [Mesorhizobium sp.]TIN47515.1 MAG: tripartite tricarboxylate transporter TctB family protein [Mesorhizobium sp.]TIR90195.1 MAG: tripartite tricarboxylate transporter TctB family protein [Mesorhizobium sp.]TIS02013.1 MAG: tripartite tricarboxylate tran